MFERRARCLVVVLVLANHIDHTFLILLRRPFLDPHKGVIFILLLLDHSNLVLLMLLKHNLRGLINFKFIRSCIFLKNYVLK